MLFHDATNSFVVVRCPITCRHTPCAERSPRQAGTCASCGTRSVPSTGFTLVEMLIAMAITLVMIGAVVTLFANVSNSVRDRRAVVEMSGQLRHARNMLQQDLQGATCNGLSWQRPDENQGYIEIIEGPRRRRAGEHVRGRRPHRQNWPHCNPEIDHATSIIPASNLPFRTAEETWATDGGGLGDFDDILMLTVRNEHEPFVGRVPGNDADQRSHTSSIRPDASSPTRMEIGSRLQSSRRWRRLFGTRSKIPAGTGERDGFFGEPGMRTIYRRALLIAPWVNPYRFWMTTTMAAEPRWHGYNIDDDGDIVDTFTFDGDQFQAKPGLVRILRDSVDRAMCLKRSPA